MYRIQTPRSVKAVGNAAQIDVAEIQPAEIAAGHGDGFFIKKTELPENFRKLQNDLSNLKKYFYNSCSYLHLVLYSIVF